jgi:hypothetical protein
VQVRKNKTIRRNYAGSETTSMSSKEKAPNWYRGVTKSSTVRRGNQLMGLKRGCRFGQRTFWQKQSHVNTSYFSSYTAVQIITIPGFFCSTTLSKVDTLRKAVQEVGKSYANRAANAPNKQVREGFVFALFYYFSECYCVIAVW